MKLKATSFDYSLHNDGFPARLDRLVAGTFMFYGEFTVILL